MICAVFYNSGFKRTLCGSKWDPVNGITGSSNAFGYLGSSTARYGCCPAGKYMSSPDANPFSIATSCSAHGSCPAGYYGSSGDNDEIIKCPICERGKSSIAGSTSCDLRTCAHARTTSNTFCTGDVGSATSQTVSFNPRSRSNPEKNFFFNFNNIIILNFLYSYYAFSYYV